MKKEITQICIPYNLNVYLMRFGCGDSEGYRVIDDIEDGMKAQVQTALCSLRLLDLARCECWHYPCF